MADEGPIDEEPDILVRYTHHVREWASMNIDAASDVDQAGGEAYEGARADGPPIGQRPA
jgi:hypothetical protein